MFFCLICYIYLFFNILYWFLFFLNIYFLLKNENLIVFEIVTYQYLCIWRILLWNSVISMTPTKNMSSHLQKHHCHGSTTLVPRTSFLWSQTPAAVTVSTKMQSYSAWPDTAIIMYRSIPMDITTILKMVTRSGIRAGCLPKQNWIFLAFHNVFKLKCNKVYRKSGMN